ncbi:MAG: polysaccharide biosynthesis tyrosine autokinase [Chloroflexota bacterium]
MHQEQEGLKVIQQYLRLLQKWWWIPVLSVVVGAAGAYFTSRQQPQIFEASATLLVGQVIQSKTVSTQDFQTSESLARTYAIMAEQHPVLQNVVDTLQLKDSWEDLKRQISVSPIQSTQLLRITAQAASPSLARMIANEVANQLILLSPTGPQDVENTQKQAFVAARLDNLQAKIEAGQTRIQELETLMTGVLPSDQVRVLQQEINTLEGLLTNWENNHTQLLIFADSQQSPNYLAVTEPAYGSTIPIQPNVRSSTFMGVLIALIFSGGILFLINMFDDTFKTGADLARILGLANLGSIIRIKARSPRDRLINASSQFSPFTEAYRMVRTNIQFVSVDQPIKSILITSALADEGKSLTAANLAITMAQAGLRTILVDADLRRPSLHQIFQISNVGGLTGLLQSDDARPEHFLTRTSLTNLQILPSGNLPPNPTELIGSNRMRTTITNLTKIADAVIFDSPPVLALADATLLANRVDATVLVIRAEQTRYGPVKQALINLQQASASLIGGILNQVSNNQSDYYAQSHLQTQTTSPASQSVSTFNDNDQTVVFRG